MARIFTNAHARAFVCFVVVCPAAQVAGYSYKVALRRLDGLVIRAGELYLCSRDLSRKGIKLNRYCYLHNPFTSALHALNSNLLTCKHAAGTIS